jgi:hypothetical protein
LHHLLVANYHQLLSIVRTPQLWKRFENYKISMPFWNGSYSFLVCVINHFWWVSEKDNFCWLNWLFVIAKKSNFDSITIELNNAPSVAHIVAHVFALYKILNMTCMPFYKHHCWSTKAYPGQYQTPTPLRGLADISYIYIVKSANTTPKLKRTSNSESPTWLD